MNYHFQGAAVRRERERRCKGPVRPRERGVDLVLSTTAVIAEVPDCAGPLTQPDHGAETEA